MQTMRADPTQLRRRGRAPRLARGPWLGALVAVLLCALLSPAPGWAHTRLERSIPADSARLSAVPGELRLVFSGPVELAFTQLRLFDPDGREMELGAAVQPADSARVVVAEILDLPSAGTYTVVWQTAAPDGHPLRGQLAFTVAPGAAGLPAGESLGPGRSPVEHRPAAPVPALTGFDAGSPLYAALRWWTFAALLGLIGVAAFRVLVLTVLRRQHIATQDFLSRAAGGAARLGLAAAGLLAVAALLRLLAQSYALRGAEGVFDAGRIAAMLTTTTWGWGWLLQAAAAAVALAGLLVEPRRHTAGWTLVTLSAIALAFTPALSGHAASNPDRTALAVLADGLHVLGAGGWLGSLLAVIVVGLPVAHRLPERARGMEIAALVNAFSPIALFFAGMVVATGILSAWLNLGSVPALWTTSYGRVLLFKLGVLSVVFAAGAYNWLRVRPALGTGESASRLRRSSALELAFGVLVLAVTAVLVATPPPSHGPTPAGEVSVASEWSGGHGSSPRSPLPRRRLTDRADRRGW